MCSLLEDFDQEMLLRVRKSDHLCICYISKFWAHNRRNQAIKTGGIWARFLNILQWRHQVLSMKKKKNKM
jgi:hypothetical protein